MAVDASPVQFICKFILHSYFKNILSGVESPERKSLQCFLKVVVPNNLDILYISRVQLFIRIPIVFHHSEVSKTRPRGEFKNSPLFSTDLKQLKGNSFEQLY